MKKHLFVLGVCLLSLFIISCKRQNAPNTYSVIPYPNSLVQEDGTFVFNKKTKMICTSSLDSASQEVVRNFSALLNNVAGLKTECIVEEEKREKNIVFFDLDTSIADEGYSLDIDPSKIIIKASSAAQDIANSGLDALGGGNYERTTLWWDVEDPAGLGDNRWWERAAVGQ